MMSHTSDVQPVTLSVSSDGRQVNTSNQTTTPVNSTAVMSASSLLLTEWTSSVIKLLTAPE